MISAEDIGNLFFEAKIIGHSNRTISKISKITPGEPDALSFCKFEGKRAAELIGSSHSSIIICSSKLVKMRFQDKTLILVPQPRLAFMKVANHFFSSWRQNNPMIHPTAVISNAKIGENVRIGPHTVIGEEGFGYLPDEDGTLIQFPHIGRVIIEDDVEIGANVCIDRGALGDTIIGRGTKIDNLVHIAHNVRIGKNCQIICQVGIGGSVEIGDNCFVGIGASIRNQKKIGNNVFIGMGTIVVKDVPDNMTVAGNPASPIHK